MNDSTKKVLIISTSVVIIVIAYLFLRPSPPYVTMKCNDGRIIQIILPDPFLIKYSGKKIGISIEVQKKLKQSIGLEDVLLQQATESTQNLNEKLKLVILTYNSRPCEERSQSMFDKLQNYMLQDSERINRVQINITNLAKSGTKEEAKKATELVRQLVQETNNASKNLQ